ncbi:hypothetical protein F4819DRAFT_472912, partial [Hypoxylon fuscum]
MSSDSFIYAASLILDVCITCCLTRSRADGCKLSAISLSGQVEVPSSIRATMVFISTFSSHQSLTSHSKISPPSTC